MKQLLGSNQRPSIAFAKDGDERERSGASTWKSVADKALADTCQRFTGPFFVLERPTTLVVGPFCLSFQCCSTEVIRTVVDLTSLSNSDSLLGCPCSWCGHL